MINLYRHFSSKLAKNNKSPIVFGSAYEKRDYLFIDEAGQVSLANLVGMSQCCKNIILMGGQMQLSQPVQGSATNSMSVFTNLDGEYDQFFNKTKEALFLSFYSQVPLEYPPIWVQRWNEGFHKYIDQVDQIKDISVFIDFYQFLKNEIDIDNLKP